MLYLFQVYALVITAVLLPVLLLYTLSTLSSRAIVAVRDTGRALKRAYHSREHRQHPIGA